jgi:hypothetical protein
MSLADLKNKSPKYNWDIVQQMTVTDVTTFDSKLGSPLDSMDNTNAEQFNSDYGNYKTAPYPPLDNDKFISGESPPTPDFETVKYGNNQYKGTRFDDADTYVGSSLGNSLVSQNFNFDLNQQFNEKLASMRYFSDLYNDDQTVTDAKLTGPGGSDKLNMSTAVYNSGYRRAYLSGQGGNNDYGTEPYYIKKVRKTNSGGVFDGLTTQVEQAGRDVVRISKFLTSPAGLAFFAKQNLLGINARPNPYGSKGVSLTKEPGALEKGFLKEGGKLARWLPLAQKYKPFYIQSSTLANVASGLIGVQGSRIVRFDRDWPLESGGAFGGSNLNYTDYHNLTHHKNFTYDDKLFYNGQRSHRWQNHNEGITAASNVNTSMDPKTKRGTKGFGDFMTLMEFNSESDYTRTLKQAHPNDHKDINHSKNGMPFYFYDMRTNQYIIFRAYIESLTENIAPEWNPEKYVGRSEPVYTYTGAERDISFSLKMFAHTADELKMIYKKMNRLTSLCYPEYKVDTTLQGTPPSAAPLSWSEKFTRMKSPMTKLRLGELYGKSGNETIWEFDEQSGANVEKQRYVNNDLTGFIKSLAYSIPDESPWEIKQGMRVPKYITVALTYQVIHSGVPNVDTKFYGYTGD